MVIINYAVFVDLEEKLIFYQKITDGVLANHPCLFGTV